MFGPALLALATASASLVLAETAWQPNQVSTRICQWQQLRVYLDGGNIWWQPGFADGSAGNPVNDNNRLGVIYTLNFSIPFNTTQNISAILTTLSTGGGNTNNRAPNYEDGALLANNEQFFLYGGLLQRTASVSDPPGDSVLCYERHQYGPPRTFSPSFINKELGDNVTRYVAYGGAANAPSENLAWYFSGLRSPSGGPIYTKGGATASTSAVNVSNHLITLDMAEQRDETFTNDTLPSDIPGRANPELVWVPVGSRGILVAIGGVVYPDFITVEGDSTDPEASTAQSPGFISTIDVYDVESKNWYRQRTSGGPPQRTRGCAVVARAQDGSSFNIYYYGGYDGLTQNSEPFSDDVWVLSLPSFTWVRLASGANEGRAGHKCVMPYPDQMMVIGGYPHFQGSTLGCLRETIRVFNLSTGQWLGRYDPAVYSNYTVPSAVLEKIGGSGTGGATATTPSPSWDATELGAIFAAQYPTSKIATYYPYASAAPTNNTNPPAPTTTVESPSGGLPAYLPPVLGVVLGLVFLTMVAVLILLWRRRRLLRSGTISEAGTEDTNGNRIASWLRGQPTASEAKAPTVTSSSDYSPVSATDVDSVGLPPRSIAEMMNTEVPLPVELPDTSPPAELHSTTATPSSLNNPAHSPTTHQTDHASAQPPSPFLPGQQPHPQQPSSSSPVESPVYYPTTSSAFTASPTAASPYQHQHHHNHNRDSNKVLSGISNLSERDRAHLRQISDTTVSSVTTNTAAAAPGYHYPGSGSAGAGTGNVTGAAIGQGQGSI
ncbi:hypothetical protein N658DRAFT_487751 [Parathielavia hyrcaniae]|uniref:Kelch repeat-containing protein n=1 Tax=Parathielavia hyrcaniae TaxID=113614 RepID=A0AAN6T038_9PEZI|nr:hypothetical protein N658DRAFT_487751 [Parathielavia hyrcaniae]